MPGFDRHRRIPADDGVRLDIAHDTTLGRDLRSGPYRDVVRDACLTAHHDAVADHRAAGDAYLRANHAVAAKPDIVGDVDEIIEHAAGADHGVLGGAAIDGAVGTDLHPI